MVSQKLREETDMGGSVLVLEFFDMRKIIQTKLTDTAFANRGTTLNGVLSLRWENPANDMRYRQWSRDLQMLFKEELDETRKNGITSGEGVPQYINYAEPGDIVVPSIYGVNGERLQKLKARYDPDSVFGKMNPIIPAK
ncbi:FAD binding domain -containing protein [Coccidioides immitis RMSCC 3703]|nr:FAD binding domain -containing protein [Coccidioides immitis RMSCC 3703]